MCINWSGVVGVVETLEEEDVEEETTVKVGEWRKEEIE